MSEAFATNNSYLYEAPNQTGSPERMLLLAILERAILDYVGNDRREAEASQDWIFGEMEMGNSEPFSFHWVCRELDLSPVEVAKTIQQMPKRGTRRIAPWYFQRWQRDGQQQNDDQKEELQN